jgi:hypothetical protein
MDPSDYHPDLAEDRLVEVARILLDVRRKALTEHNPEVGDGPWGLGCRVYERSCYAIGAASDHSDWLTVIDPSMRFQFTVGSVPMRFYRGDPEKPNLRTLRQHYPELAQVQLLLSRGEHWDDANTFWRIAVETDDEGDVTRIALVQISMEDESKADVLYSWDIPLDGAVTPLAPVRPPSAPVELSPPSVGDRTNEGDTSQADED